MYVDAMPKLYMDPIGQALDRALRADDQAKKIIYNSTFGLASKYMNAPFTIKVMSEDPFDDRLMLEYAGGMLVDSVSRIDGRPIFKVVDVDAFEKIKPDLEKIGQLQYVSSIDFSDAKESLYKALDDD